MSGKRILYHAVHEILEYDDLRLLNDAGFTVFSMGSYGNPEARGNRFRGHHASFANHEDFVAAVAGGTTFVDGRLRVTREFVARFDAVIVNQNPLMVLDNLEAFGNVPVIYRTLGQSTFAWEEMLKPVADRLTVVRYSEHEIHPDFLPTRAIIPFGKYVDEYPLWSGGGDVLTFMNTAARQAARPEQEAYQELVAGFSAKLYGLDNEGIANAAGLVSPDAQLDLYRRARCYVYIHSLVASYTLNFMEAMLVGAPILAPSQALVSAQAYPDWWPERYAIEPMLAEGAGLIYGSVAEGRDILANLERYDLQALSQTARARARGLFNAPSVISQWQDFIAGVT